MSSLYGVRQVGTNKFLPQVKGRAGFTNDEPEENGGAHGPRIFNTKQGAHLAARAWKLGRHRVAKSWNTPLDEPDFSIVIEPVPARDEVELEIVRLVISVDLRDEP